MKALEEKYHLVVDSNLRGSYYVSYSCIGSGHHKFYLDKSPIRYYSTQQECRNVKVLLEEVLNNDYSTFKEGNYIHIEEERIEEIGGIAKVKIQKSVIVSEIEISYID